jgi:Flp pilus assembly protein TadG
MTRTLNRQRGQTTVEFALVALLVLIPLLVGIIESGRYVYSISAVTNAAREGARYAIAQGNLTNQDPTTTCPGTVAVPATAPAAVASAAALATSGVGPLTVKTSLDTSQTPGNPPAWCQVTVSYQFNPVGGGFNQLPASPISATSRQYFN